MQLEQQNNDYLNALLYYNLNKVFDVNELKKRHRQALLYHHPDKGGNIETYQRVVYYYTILMELYEIQNKKYPTHDEILANQNYLELRPNPVMDRIFNNEEYDREHHDVTNHYLEHLDAQLSKTTNTKITESNLNQEFDQYKKKIMNNKAAECSSSLSNQAITKYEPISAVNVSQSTQLQTYQIGTYSNMTTFTDLTQAYELPDIVFDPNNDTNQINQKEYEIKREQYSNQQYNHDEMNNINVHDKSIYELYKAAQFTES